MRDKRLRDEVGRNQVGRNFPNHFLGIRRLEDHVMVLDAGIDEDGVEGGKIGEDTLDVPLQVGEIGHVPLRERCSLFVALCLGAVVTLTV